MQAEQVSAEIKDAIAYNNAKNVSVSIECEKEMGTVFPQPTYQAKVGYDFEVQFIPNTTNYIIKNPQKIFKAVSYIDESQSRDDCVQFTVIEQSFEDKKNGLYRVRVKILKEATDIKITPVCIKKPWIEEIYPTFDSGYSAANTPITVTFNMNIENSDVLQKLRLLLSSNETDLSEYFETPVLSEDKTSVIIEPKPKKLQSYIRDTLKAAFIDVVVNFDENIKIQTGDLELPLSDNGGTIFKVRYKPELETEAPKNYGFFVSATEFDLSSYAAFSDRKKFTVDALEDFDNDAIKKNRTSGTVYIYGKYYDNGSGVRTITLNEQRITDKYGWDVADDTLRPAIYTAKDITFVTDAIGNTEFCIKYDIRSKDGAILLTLSAADGCENTVEAENKTVYAIKDSGTDLSDVVFSNYISDLQNIYFVEKVIETDTGKYFNYSDIFTYGDPIEKPNPMLLKTIYKSCVVPSQYLSIKCEYTDDSGNVVSSTFTQSTEDDEIWMHPNAGEGQPVTKYLWKAKLNNVSTKSLPGKTIKLVVIDDIGNRSEKEFSFPAVPVVGRIEKGNSYSYVYFINRGANDTLSYYNGSKYSSTPFLNLQIDNSKTYKVNFRRGTDGLYGPSSQEFNADLTGLQTLDPVQDISLSYAKNPKPIDFNDDHATFSLRHSGYTDVTVSIADNSWDNFDKIYCLFNENIYYFEKPQTTVTIPILTLAIYNDYGQTLTLFGEKGNSITSGTELNVKVNETKYDNAPPKVDVSKKSANIVDPDTISLGEVTEAEAGLDYIIVTSDSFGDIKYTLAADADELQIPVWDIDDNQKLDIKVYDKVGNVTQKTFDCVLPAIPKIINTYLSGYIETDNFLNPDRTYVNFYDWKYEIYALEVEDNVLTWQLYNSGNYNSGDKPPANHLAVVIPDCTSNAYYKIVVSAKNTDTGYAQRNYTDAVYYYKGYYNEEDPDNKFVVGQSTGKYDYIMPKTSSSVLVSSDAPVFVHTLVTKIPYSECKDWDVEKWEHHRKELGMQKLDFTKLNTTGQKYTIPVGQINEGECYVVVAHFSNGGTDISEVFQK